MKHSLHHRQFSACITKDSCLLACYIKDAPSQATLAKQTFLRAKALVRQAFHTNSQSGTRSVAPLRAQVSLLAGSCRQYRQANQGRKVCKQPHVVYLNERFPFHSAGGRWNSAIQPSCQKGDWLLLSWVGLQINDAARRSDACGWGVAQCLAMKSLSFCYHSNACMMLWQSSQFAGLGRQLKPSMVWSHGRDWSWPGRRWFWNLPFRELWEWCNILILWTAERAKYQFSILACIWLQRKEMSISREDL